MVAYGTVGGNVFVVDCSGSVVIKNFLSEHSSTIIDLSLSEDNSVVASIAKGDPVITINFIFEQKNRIYYNFSKSRLFSGGDISSIAIDPCFGKAGSSQLQRFCFGTVDGKLLLHTRSWIGGGSDAILHHGEGPIYCVRWQGDLLAWANNRGIRIFDMRFERGVCIVDPSTDWVPLELNVSGIYQRAATNSSGFVENNDMSFIELPPVPLEPKLTWSNTSAIDTAATDYLLYICWHSCCKVVSISSTKEEKTRQVGVRTVIYKDQLAVRNILHIAPFGMEAVAILCIGSNAEQKGLCYVDKSTSYMVSETFTIDIIICRLTNDIFAGKVVRKAVNDLLYPEDTIALEKGLIPIPGEEPLLLVYSTCIMEQHVSMNEEEQDEEQHSIDENNMKELQSLEQKATRQNLKSVRLYSAIERIKWMLQRERYREALETAESAPASELLKHGYSIEQLGEQFLNHLLERESYETFAYMLPRIISGGDIEMESLLSHMSSHLSANRMEKESSDGIYTSSNRKRRWEQWIKRLIQMDKLQVIVSLIPCRDPTLSQEIYNNVLTYLLTKHPLLFADIVNTWPADVYNIGRITRELEQHIDQRKKAAIKERNEEKILSKWQEALATLYTTSGRYDKTLELMFEDGDITCFDYIREHTLYEAIRSTHYIQRLFEISERKAGELLANAPESLLAPEIVVPILQEIGNRRWLFIYLDTIFVMDPSRATAFHPMQVSLYAEFAPDRLSEFLKESTAYSLDNALDEISRYEEKQFSRERVYILSRMGDLFAALDIILHEMDQVDEAIVFCKEHDDPSLWNRLLEYAENDGRILVALLYDPSCGVDSLKLVKMMKKETVVPHLRDVLHRAVREKALERELREESCRAIVWEMDNLFEQFRRQVHQGTRKQTKH
eukprot:jgi/Galph1/909/GphlegSOOS_G5674.1